MRQLAGIVLVAVLGLLAGPAVSSAQTRAARTYGVADDVLLTLGAYAFTGADAASGAAFGVSGQGRYCTAAPCFWEAPVTLPAGAVIQGLELAACDSHATNTVTATLVRNVDPEAGSTNLATVATGGTPGCDFFFTPLGAPETVDNLNNRYTVQVVLNGVTTSTRLLAVRIFYRLQVSPAPAFASFSDVPVGHPFFPFVEALVAAGITQGCAVSPPRFCPDDPITRKQMAAFIAKALGLHFSP